MVCEMNTEKIKKIVIAGGGTSGWLAAAAFSKLLGKNLEVCLIESDDIGRIGVGEATIPPMRGFNKLLGIDEREFMREIQATFKLGIEFKGWGTKDDSYIHSFGSTGKDCWACDFQHFWLGGLKKGFTDDFGDYCVELQAAKAGKILGSDQSGVNYAYHLDAGLYAEFLKKHAFKYGAQRLEGKIESVQLDNDSGYIKSLILGDGQVISGDLFLDCTGFSARLISGALNVGYEPYGHYLPCDSAVAVQTEKFGDPRPYTQSIAHDSGWQWRIPLQNRVGNGLVYCSRYMNDDDAKKLLLSNLESTPITDVRGFKYNTGRRMQAWSKNCIAIGLASGFLEPLESTSIHLAMSSILRLLKLFPREKICQSNVDEFNQQSKDEVEKIRDFIILHYCATERDDSEFWRYCKNMEIPNSLKHRIDFFKETATVTLKEKELFKIDSWLQVLIGQRVHPDSYHPIVDLMSEKELGIFLTSIKRSVTDSVAKMPSHQQFIDDYCRAEMM